MNNSLIKIPVLLLLVVAGTHSIAVGFGIKASSVVGLGHTVAMSSYVTTLVYFEEFNRAAPEMIRGNFLLLIY
jgi:hypothetical protein